NRVKTRYKSQECQPLPSIPVQKIPVIAGESQRDKTGKLYIFVITVRYQYILLGLYPIFYKIIAGNGTKKNKPREMGIRGDLKNQDRNPNQTKNCHCHMDTGIQIKVKDSVQQLHIVKIEKLFITCTFG